MIYGLLYTILLVLLYVPTHMMVAEVSRNLRDELCPVKDLANLKEIFERRKSLDDYLQINIGLGQNLRTGIITLAPLVSSLLSGLLGKGF
jgi:hypothetical protein